MDMGENEICLMNDVGKVKVPESIIKRNAERQERLQKKKEEEDVDSSNAAHFDYFNKSFKQKELEIEVALAECDTLSKKELPLQYQQIADNIQLLNRHLSASSMFLTAYNLRICKETIQRLQDAAQLSEEKNLPKRKFGFKKKIEKPLGISMIDGNTKLNHVKNDNIFIPREEGTGFWNRTGEILRLSADTTSNQDITLSNLECCTVIIHGSPNTVFINSLKECTVLLGAVKTSILLYVCYNSKLVAMCQQLRIHKTELSDFYIHVTAKAIIEDSKKVRFAPYNYSYDGISKDIQQSGLDVKSNNWNDIDDFNWLVHNKQSPNWSIIPEKEQFTQWPY